MNPEPTRTVTVRRARLAAIAAAVVTVAFVPASQAIASSHGHTAPSAAVSRGGDHGRKGGAGRGSAPVATQPCGRPAERTWWPFGNVLHGSEVIETTDGGVQSTTFQRGIVQTATATSVVVTSKDDVTLTWTLDAGTAVWRSGHRGAAADLAAGQCVGIWGGGTVSAPTGRFVIIKWTPSTSAPLAPSASPSDSPSASPSASPSSSPSDSASASASSGAAA